MREARELSELELKVEREKRELAEKEAAREHELKMAAWVYIPLWIKLVPLTLLEILD